MSEPTSQVTPTLRQVRDAFAGVGVEKDIAVIEERYAQFDRFIEDERWEARQRIADSVEIALGDANPSPRVTFPAAVYLEEAEALGGRSQWAMRYADEARAHLRAREADISLRRLIRKAIRRPVPGVGAPPRRIFEGE